jgi:hypothetical protein
MDMKTRCYNLVAVSAITANAIAYITVQRDGFVVAAELTVATNSQVNSYAWSAELSVVAQFGSATNDSLGPFLFVCYGPIINNSAVGVDAQSSRATVSGIAIQVRAGDRVYINTSQSAASATFTGKVHISE